MLFTDHIISTSLGWLRLRPHPVHILYQSTSTVGATACLSSGHSLHSFLSNFSQTFLITSSSQFVFTLSASNNCFFPFFSSSFFLHFQLFIYPTLCESLFRSLSCSYIIISCPWCLLSIHSLSFTNLRST